MADIEFDTQLIKKYDIAGPRYTSYPTAVQFTPEFTEAEYRQQAEKSNQAGRDLSLYFHLPFCDTICYYCACNKVITKDRSKANPYLDMLHKEIAMQGELFDSSRKVNQLHWGGGGKPKPGCYQGWFNCCGFAGSCCVCWSQESSNVS